MSACTGRKAQMREEWGSWADGAAAAVANSMVAGTGRPCLVQQAVLQRGRGEFLRGGGGVVRERPVLTWRCSGREGGRRSVQRMCSATDMGGRDATSRAARVRACISMGARCAGEEGGVGGETQGAGSGNAVGREAGALGCAAGSAAGFAALETRKDARRAERTCRHAADFPRRLEI